MAFLFIKDCFFFAARHPAGIDMFSIRWCPGTGHVIFDALASGSSGPALHCRVRLCELILQKLEVCDCCCFFFKKSYDLLSKESLSCLVIIARLLHKDGVTLDIAAWPLHKNDSQDLSWFFLTMWRYGLHKDDTHKFGSFFFLPVKNSWIPAQG